MLKIILKLLFGGDIMAVAILWANEIMNQNVTYDRVPRGLKAKVKEILINAGCEDMVTE